MPCDPKKYPDNWGEIREQTLERDKHCCHFCGVKNYETGFRDKDGNFYSTELIIDTLDDTGHDMFEHELSNCYDKKGNPTKAIKIILTAMHLDHDTTNNEPDNLVMGCQYHHLNYDKNFHRSNARETNRKKKGLQNLF